MRLFFISACLGHNQDDSLDLFVKANSPDEAVTIWRASYNLTLEDGTDAVREVPCVVEGGLGPIQWDSMPPFLSGKDPAPKSQVCLMLSVDELDRIRIALDWYSDDRRECAKAEANGFSICEPDPAEHIAAAEEAEALRAKLTGIETTDVVGPVSESAHVSSLVLAARDGVLPL